MSTEPSHFKTGSNRLILQYLFLLRKWTGSWRGWICWAATGDAGPRDTAARPEESRGPGPRVHLRHRPFHRPAVAGGDRGDIQRFPTAKHLASYTGLVPLL
jgi:hypothetical protein